MRTFLILLFILTFASTACDALLSTPAAPAIDGQRATVRRVIDGDTIEVQIEGRIYPIRYIGMDTPEREESFYQEATAANEALVAGKDVILVKDVSETDRFGRLLRYVYLEDGTFVNAELVRLGYASAATFPPDVQHADLFVELERAARLQERGLWVEPGKPTS